MKHRISIRKLVKQVDKEYLNLRFMDRFQFMDSIRRQLVTDLKAECIDNVKNVAQEFGSDTEFMTRKGIYPYSFMDGYDRFDFDPYHVNRI